MLVLTGSDPVTKWNHEGDLLSSAEPRPLGICDFNERDYGGVWGELAITCCVPAPVYAGAGSSSIQTAQAGT